MSISLPTHLLYKAATGKVVVNGGALCALCGCGHSDSSPVGEAIKDTFTNHGMLRSPSSSVVCQACLFYFCHRWDCGQKYPGEYRKRSLLVWGEGWRDWKRDTMRADIEGWLRSGCPESVMVVGLSKKKHCLPLACVNPPGRTFQVQLEEQRVLVSPDAWFPLAEAFDGLLALGCRKGEILSGNYHQQTLKGVGAALGRLVSLDRIIRPHRPSGILTLLSYVTLTEDADGSDGNAGVESGTATAG